MEEWSLQRVGKVTSSKGPLFNRTLWPSFISGIVGLYPKMYDWVSNNRECIPERVRMLPNFDRIFYFNRNFIEDESGKNVIELKGKIILEIKTRALGYPEPLTYIHGSHIVQWMIQMCCLPDVPGCLLLSYIPKNKRFSLFLIKRDEVFIKSLKNVCNGILKQENISILFLSESIHSNELCNSVLSKIPNFKNILPLRQWANNIAARSPKAQLTPIVLNY